MPPVGGLAAVNSIVNLDSTTNLPLEGVTFNPIAAPAQALGDLGYEAGVSSTNVPWITFLSNITARVEDGIPNHFEIEVTLDGKTSAEEFLQNLRSSGAFFTGSSDAQGFPNHGHIYLKRLGDFDVLSFLPGRVLTEREPRPHLTPQLP